MPFYGPVVSHGVTGAINGVFGVLSGVTLALAFVRDHLTSLASNRNSHSPGKRSSIISETTTNRMTLFFDPNDPNLRAKIEALVPTPGYCVLVDMVGSTAMKDAPILQWAPKIHNAFANTMAFLDPSIRPLKSIGDELMFYISCEKLAERGEGALCLYSGLFSVAGEKDPLFTDVKIAIAYCERAYRLSFLPGVEDIYGKDIDLTARLLSKALPREIVMNEAFVRILKHDFETDARGNQDQFPEVNRITGPVGEPFKGFAAPVPVFRVKAG
jgi:class 3 adenylate cyclase